jgi:hypothetical protein
MPSPKDKFRLTGGDKHWKAEFTNKSEYNNMQMWLKRRGIRYDTHHKKRSRFRSEVFTIILVDDIKALD